MNGPTLIFAAATVLVAVTPAPAPFGAFTGVYAPETWTVTGAGVGGSSAIFSADGSSLTITGGDGGGGIGSTISVTHAIAFNSVWSFDYQWINFNGSSGFDFGYYLHNGVKSDISLGGSFGTSGSVSVAVSAGDTIGWQVTTVDGIFGPGILTITDFRVSVPAPAGLALLGIASIAQSRRRS